MPESTLKRAPDQPTPDLGDLLEDVLHQAKTLMQAELSLARRELVTEVKTAAGSVVLLIVAVMILQAALVTLGVLLVLALGVGLASAGVIVGLAVIGTAILLFSRRALTRQNVANPLRRLTVDAKQVMETVK